MTTNDHPKRNEEKKTFQLEIENQVSKGQYSNLSISSFTEEEFCLDFAYIQPHQNKGVITSRLILSPKNANRLKQMLTKNIEKYEEEFGPIQSKNEPPFNQQINLSIN